MDTYETAKKEAIEKVFLSIAQTGCPTKEQIAFLEAYKPKQSIDKDIATVSKLLDLMLGGKK